MQILTAEQIRQWDQYTIENEPVSSIDLMERAAAKCVDWIQTKGWKHRPFRIFCGKGNNGGDGLGIARLLAGDGYSVAVYILELGKTGSDDFQVNLQRLHKAQFTNLHFIQSEATFPATGPDDIIIDALFGSGLNKPLDGLAASLVTHLNGAGGIIVSVDLPSGLFADKSSKDATVISADHTLTFQVYKTALLVQENGPLIGEVQVLDIGLLPGFGGLAAPAYQLLDERMIRQLYHPRGRFSHKGTFGSTLIVGGSYGKMGAAVLATKACMAAGSGLTSAFVPRCGYVVMQVSAPEAMAIIDAEEKHLANLPDDIDRFSAIGVGPGMGTKPETAALLSYLIRRYPKPMVIDADGLNCLARNPEWLLQLPAGSILTPHPKEFDRLFGDHQTDFDRVETAQKKAVELGVIVLLKGHHTLIATPTGDAAFNSTGNAGMAKGGSGDVLTGILAALLAQGYAPANAAQLGVYIHGWAGEMAAKRYSKVAMLPSHLVESLADVFLLLEEGRHAH